MGTERPTSPTPSPVASLLAELEGTGACVHVQAPAGAPHLPVVAAHLFTRFREWGLVYITHAPASAVLREVGACRLSLQQPLVRTGPARCQSSDGRTLAVVDVGACCLPAFPFGTAVVDLRQRPGGPAVEVAGAMEMVAHVHAGLESGARLLVVSTAEDGAGPALRHHPRLSSLAWKPLTLTGFGCAPAR